MKILIAVDGSQRAPGVMLAGAETARRFQASIHLFRAVSLPPDIPPAAATRPDPVPARVIEHVQRELDVLARGVLKVTVETPVLSDRPPWRLILEAAKRLDVDLIVIGSHGYSGWDHLLATTAASVCNRADRNVLVVHERRPT